MTEDSARHPAAGGRGRLALRLGLGALFAAAAWLVASFFLGTASASAAEPPVPVPPTGLVSSAADSAGALSADLDRVASATLAAVGLPVPAAPVAPTPPAEPTPPAAPAPPPAPATQAASPAPSVPTAAVVSVMQHATHSLSHAVSPVLAAPIGARVEPVTDAASGLVSAVADTTGDVLPVLSRDVVGPVAETVQEVLDTVADAPIADLAGGVAGAAPISPASAEVVGAHVGPVPGARGDETRAMDAPSSARGLHTGAWLGASPGGALLEGPANPGSLPVPSLPLPNPNAGAATAGTDAAGGGSAAGPGAADLVPRSFSPATLVTISGDRTGVIRPLSPSYDSDSTPD